MNEETKNIYEIAETGHWKELFPKKNMVLGSHNLNDGEEICAVINRIEKGVEIATGRKGDPIAVINLIHFEDIPKVPPMTLNVGNARILESLYGEKYQEWSGKAIQIYKGPVKAVGGGMTTGLKIRPTKPNMGEPIDKYIDQLKACKKMDQLAKCYGSIPKHLKAAGTDSAKKLMIVKDQMKESCDA